jgi:hypothetical protein
VPATPVRCAPRVALHTTWRQSAWACEMDVLFVRRDARATGGRLRRYAAFHNLGPTGCEALVTPTEAVAEKMHQRARLRLSQDRAPVPPALLPPNGTALMTAPGTFYSRSWEGRSPHSDGEPYVCYAGFFKTDGRAESGCRVSGVGCLP